MPFIIIANIIFFLLLAWVYGCVGVCEYPMCLLRSERRSFEFLNEIYLYVHNIDIHSIGFDCLLQFKLFVFNELTPCDRQEADKTEWKTVQTSGQWH